MALSHRSGDNGRVIDTEERPILSGLLALVAVAVVVGLLGGLAMLIGVKALGIGGDAAASDGSTPTNSLYLPDPTDTGVITPTNPPSAETGAAEPTESATPQTQISLSASQVSVAAMQQIDLTGTYTGGEGAILQVQRLENGQWSDFPVTVSVSGQTFTTYVQTSRPGPNKFRMIDTDTQLTSNEVSVTVG